MFMRKRERYGRTTRRITPSKVTRQSPISWVGVELDRSCTFWSMPSDSGLILLTTGWSGESNQGAGAVASASALTGTLYL